MIIEIPREISIQRGGGGQVRVPSFARPRAMAPRTPRDAKRKRDVVTQILPKSKVEEKTTVQQDFPRGRPEGDKVRPLEPTRKGNRAKAHRTAGAWMEGRIRTDDGSIPRNV